MARREKARSTVRRAGAAIKRTTPKVKTTRAVSRPAKRQPDVPMDEITRSYAPKQTSLKTSFRATGADRQRDQDVPGERWNDEDHYTNKSGDPRIGTHGRAYEPGERRREGGVET